MNGETVHNQSHSDTWNWDQGDRRRGQAEVWMSCSADVDRGFTTQGTLSGYLGDPYSIRHARVSENKDLRYERASLFRTKRARSTFTVKSRKDIKHAQSGRNCDEKGILGEGASRANPLSMLITLQTDRKQSSYRLPKPKAIVDGSLTFEFSLPSAINLSGLKSSGNG